MLLMPLLSTRYVALIAGALASATTVLAAQMPTTGVIRRVDLGPAAAFRVDIQWGRVIVKGTDATDITYRIIRDTEGPKHDSLLKLPLAVPYHIETTTSGVAIIMSPAESEGFIAAELQVSIPRNLPFLSVEMNRGGSIEVRDFDGELTVINRNGDTRLERLGGAVLVEATNGSIAAGLNRTIMDKPVSLLARNGGVTLDLAAGVGGTISAETRSGRVLSNRPIQVAELPERGRSAEYRPRRASVSLGAPGPLIRIMTLNGDVIIQRR